MNHQSSISGQGIPGNVALRSPLAMSSDELNRVVSICQSIDPGMIESIRVNRSAAAQRAQSERRPQMPSTCNTVQAIAQWQAAMRPSAPRAIPLPFQRIGSVAIVHLNGFLAKYPSWLFYFVRGTSTLDFAEAVSAAARDTLVKSIVLIVDSGGGEVAGAFQAAQAVYDARKKMRVVAVTSDLNASSAFLISSQANEVVINESGFLGSIGVYAILADYSGMYERAGIKVNVVRADGADFKGIGEPGSEITPAQLAEVKRRVEQTHNLFLRHVARGRNLPVDRVRALATGQAFGSSEAIRNKLADRVVSDPESVITELDRPFAEQLAKM